MKPSIVVVDFFNDRSGRISGDSRSVTFGDGSSSAGFEESTLCRSTGLDPLAVDEASETFADVLSICLLGSAASAFA